MNKVFYPRIAMINLRNNGRTYVPYLLTCILSTAMFYVICSLSLNPDLDTMLGGGYMRTLLQMGTWIVALFRHHLLVLYQQLLDEAQEEGIRRLQHPGDGKAPYQQGHRL